LIVEELIALTDTRRFAESFVCFVSSKNAPVGMLTKLSEDGAVCQSSAAARLFAPPRVTLRLSVLQGLARRLCQGQPQVRIDIPIDCETE
jgi:hypothetical protein